MEYYSADLYAKTKHKQVDINCWKIWENTELINTIRMAPHMPEYELPNIVSGRCIIDQLRSLRNRQWRQ
jgi:hypothetical protein